MKLTTVNERNRQRREAIAQQQAATPPAARPRPLVNASTGHVDRNALAAVLPTFRECRADAVVEAAERYGRAVDAAAALQRSIAQAPSRVSAALAAHADAVTAAIAEGREPQLGATWAAVVAAREAVDCGRSSTEPARLGILTAAHHLRHQLARAWPVVLPWLAKQRPRRHTDPMLNNVAYAIVWPVLHVGPGTAGMNTTAEFHFQSWWPLSFVPLSKTIHRSDRIEWEEWAWSELATGRFDIDNDGFGVNFHSDWHVPEPDYHTPAGAAAVGSPAVEVSAAAVEQYRANKAAASSAAPAGQPVW